MSTVKSKFFVGFAGLLVSLAGMAALNAPKAMGQTAFPGGKVNVSPSEEITIVTFETDNGSKIIVQVKKDGSSSVSNTSANGDNTTTMTNSDGNQNTEVNDTDNDENDRK